MENKITYGLGKCRSALKVLHRTWHEYLFVCRLGQTPLYHLSALKINKQMIYKHQPQKFVYLSMVYRRLLTFETNHVNLEKEKVKDLLATTTNY